MDVNGFGNWVLVGSLLFCVVFGAVILSVVSISHYKTLKLAIPSLIFGILGGFLMSSPKWTEIAFKWGDWEAKLAKSEQIETELGEAKNQIAVLSSLSQKYLEELKTNQQKISSLQFQNLEWTTASIKQAASFQAGWIDLKSKIQMCPECPASSLNPATKSVDDVLALWKASLPKNLDQQ